VIDIMASLKAARTIGAFVETGQLEAALSDIGMAAAVNALQKVPHADQRNMPVWSAVNHLEGAEAALVAALRRRAKLIFWANPLRGEVLDEKRKYVLCLMAICYRYLREEQLALQALERAGEEVNEDPFDMANERLLNTWGFLLLVNPLTYIGLARRGELLDLQEVKAQIQALPTGTLPPDLPKP
jgi:hypothetical protein